MAQSEHPEIPQDLGQSAGGNRLTRRQVMGRAGAVAATGAVAWVVPEILIAQPGSAAGLSGNPGGNGSGSVGASTGVSTPAGGASAGAGASASSTGGGASVDTGVSAGGGDEAAMRDRSSTTSRRGPGLDIERDARVAEPLRASGWGLQHWSSRG